MLVLLILISLMGDMGIDEKAELLKKETDISTYGTSPIYTEGVKRKIANPLLWSQLLFEDFESGTIPASWTVVNGNADSYTWQIYSSVSWRSTAMPADPGNYVVAYDDDAAGTNPATEEELILPAFSSTPYDSIALIYSFGYQNYAGYDTFAIRVRTHNGASWGGWNNLVLYYTDQGSGLWDTLSIAPYLPADSFQIEFNWWDHHSTHYDWYAAVDNIKILANIGGGGLHDIGVAGLNSPPALMDVYAPYPVISTFHNFGTSTMSFNAHTEITDTSGSPTYFTKDSTISGLLPDSSITINFGNWTLNNPGFYRYIACTTTPDSTSYNDTLDRTLAANIEFATDTLISPPTGCSRGVPYDVIAAFTNNGTADTMADIHVEISKTGSPVFVASSSIYIPPDSTIAVNFGPVTFTSCGMYDYTANIYFPFDLQRGNDTLTTTISVSPWEIVTQMPENLMDQAVVFDGNDIFVIGGYEGSMVTSNDVHKFTPDSATGGTWSLCDSMPIGLCMFDACLLGDTIYVPGGYSYALGLIVDTLFKYSISGDNWTSGPGTGDTAWFYTCEAANGKVYRIGGYNNNTGTICNSTWEYDPSTGSWTPRATMPLPLELTASWVRNDTIYLAGGVDPNVFPYYHQSQIYDAVNNTWTMDSSVFAYLPDMRYGTGGAIFRDTAFVMGGSSGGGTLDSVYYYTFDGTNTWNIYPCLINSVFRADGIAVDGIGYACDGVYLFGGDVGGFNPQSFVQARITYSSGIEEDQENTNAELLSIPRSISFNQISFSYIGNKAADITVSDVAGRVVQKYTDVEPGSNLNFGNGQSTGIYFISVKGTTGSKKAVLIR